MIERIVDYCAHNRFLVLVAIGALAIYGFYCLRNVPVDAIPDLSDTQVIVFSRWDRSPDIIEDQVTYPIVTALLGAPKVKDIRGFSDYGFSYVYVIFQDGTDIYWARSRTLEYLSKILPNLPKGVTTELGPDATGVGWVYQYALVDETGKHNLQEIRSFQDWYLRFWLQAVPGVAEVATVGGFVKQYQVTVDPNVLAAYGLSLSDVMERVRRSNDDVGARLLEHSGAEFMVTGRGYLKSTHDLEQVVLKVDARGTPVRVRDVARVAIGPEIRRGVADLDGRGDAVGGIVVMRFGENANTVIAQVKKKLKEIEPSLPEGVKIVTTYDRSDLIHRAIDTLKHQLVEEMIVVSVVILIFLLHVPSAVIPIVTLPMAVLLAFIPMRLLGINSNIMSLGGIAVAIGAMVDAAVVVVENSHKKLEIWEREGRKGDYVPVLIKAIQEVARPSFYSLLVIAVSFMPIFALEEQEGRLFKPLAFTKNFAMILAAVLAITLDPALRLTLIRLKEFSFRPRFLAGTLNAIVVGKMYSEEKHPISRFLHWLYEPAIHVVLRFPKTVLALAFLTVIGTVPVYMKLGAEFMPPLNEGTILYMPTTLPGISVTEAQRLLQVQDKILRSFPEVVTVFGKAGRADTSTDPAPLSMMETTVILKPVEEWRTMKRWYSDAPRPVRWVLNRFWPERMTWDELVNEMDTAMRFPGVTNAWTMPIKARIDMLTTGVRTPVGIKIFGADIREIERIGERIEMILKDIPSTRSIYAERTAGGFFLNFQLKRDEIARHGLTIEDVQMVLLTAVGGENITTTIEGRERYPVNIRYPRDLRENEERLKRVLVATPQGAHIPIAQLADITRTAGPGMIRDENGMLAGYVYVDIDTAARDIGSYVDEAKQAVAEKLKLQPGYTLVWSGQYEAMERVYERLKLVVPITLFIVFILIYLNTQSLVKTFIVLLAVPFSAVGAVWLLYALGYHMSIGVWVGLIALLGVDAETGIFMLVYLDLAYEEAKAQGRMRNREDLKEAIIHGAVKRVRPKVMTVTTTIMGLLPIMYSLGTGADVMKRIAAPMVGGLFTSFIMELLVYPVIYELWKRREIRKNSASAG